MNKPYVIVLLGLTAAVTGGCRAPLPPPEPEPVRAELTVLRTMTYADAAVIAEEEGTYFWQGQTLSPFAIRLTFNDPFARERAHTVHFATNSATLNAEERIRLVELLPELPAGKVRLAGYADPRGSDAHNLDLSRRRADAVAAWLRTHGVVVEEVGAYGEQVSPQGVNHE